MHDGDREWTVPLVVRPQDLHRVRRIVRAHLRLWELKPLVDDSLKIVTELLTNVHRHVDGRAVLILRATTDLLIITVHDNSSVVPTVCQPDWDSSTGRGMWLVEQLSYWWKAEPTTDGKDVQCALRVPTTEDERPTDRQPVGCSA
ncbi:ATP-binding protein [Streptomyces sp. NPDC006265]|uniref:ATP-binding protein n=1 Tax=Streptomyces sp. NPDC006265 TaxID=3156740 RepID=UPI0033B8A4FF